MIERIGLKEEGQILLPAIANRMNKLPFAEVSEEVRIQLLELLEVCLEADKYQFMAQLGAIGSMLARAAQDENPEMKSKVASFAGQLSRELPEKVGPYMKTCTDSLVRNLGHQHKNVRKGTLKGLRDVLSARNAEVYMADCIKELKVVMNDRSQDVRKTFYEVVRHWMTSMDIKSVRMFESTFILFLLNGIADEVEEIARACETFLEEHGARMKDALQQLGEDEEMHSTN